MQRTADRAPRQMDRLDVRSGDFQLLEAARGRVSLANGQALGRDAVKFALIKGDLSNHPHHARRRRRRRDLNAPLRRPHFHETLPAHIGRLDIGKGDRLHPLSQDLPSRGDLFGADRRRALTLLFADVSLPTARPNQEQEQKCDTDQAGSSLHRDSPFVDRCTGRLHARFRAFPVVPVGWDILPRRLFDPADVTIQPAGIGDL